MQPWLQTGLTALVVMGMLVGLFGLAVPFFPGVIVVWLSILAYGLFRGFSLASGILFGVITVLMLGSTVVDNVLMGMNARQRGTSWLALGVSMVTLLVGSILWTPLGGLAVSFVAVFLVELLRLKDWRRALESVKGMAMGCGWATAARFGIALAMIGLWFVWFEFIS